MLKKNYVRKIVALIINWNGSDDTKELIESLIPQINKNLVIDFIVIDNNSNLENIIILEQIVSIYSTIISIKLIKNSENIGIPAAYNQAINSCDYEYDYYLRLDNDVVILENGVDKLCKAMEMNKKNDIKIVGCNIKYYKEKNKNNGGSYSFDLLKGRNNVSYPLENTITDGVLGCVMLIDKTVINEFKPEVFDSWLFISADESELSIRCKNLGWKTLYLAENLAFHKSGISTSKSPSLTTYCNIRNWTYLALKYAPYRVISMPFILIRLLSMYTYYKSKNNVIKHRAVKDGILKFIFNKNQNIKKSI